MTTLGLIRSALQDAICWEQSRFDAGIDGPNKLKEYETLLNELGHITREKAFARELKVRGATLVNAFDLTPFNGKPHA
jgi:hypothetical protein